MGYTDPDSLYEAIGYKRFNPLHLINKLIPQEKKQEIQVKEGVIKEKKVEKGVRIEGVDNILIRFAKCCYPVPGDDIIGYVTRGRGVTIHRAECPNLKNFSQEEERFIKADWYDTEDNSFPVNIKIISVDRKSLISDISMVLSNQKAGIKYIKGVANKNNVAIINLTIAVNTLEHLKEVMARLRSLKAVKEVIRMEGD